MLNNNNNLIESYSSRCGLKMLGYTQSLSLYCKVRKTISKKSSTRKKNRFKTVAEPRVD